MERCCCVVKLSDSACAQKSVSCSGVIVHHQTGTLMCIGVPFSRFLTHSEPLPADHRFLSKHSFRDTLQIRVSCCNGEVVDHDAHGRRGPSNSSSRTRTTYNQEVPAQLLMLVNCLEFKQAFQSLFLEADQWRFHDEYDGQAEDADLMRDAQFLSWFAVLQVGVDDSPGSGVVPWQASSSLLKGCPVVACGSPFGSLCLDLFISTLSRGIISNLAGEDNAIILTDARCLPGTEGGGLFAVRGADSVCLVGLIVSPFGWKANEWIGLTLVCSVHSIFKNIIQCSSTEDPLRDVWLCPGGANVQMCATACDSDAVKYPTVCLVDSGPVWGSGVVVTSRMVVTCRHVVAGRPTVTLKFHHRDR